MGALTGCDSMNLTLTIMSASKSFRFGLNYFNTSTLWWAMYWRPWETCLMSSWVCHVPATTCISPHSNIRLFQCPEFAHPGTYLEKSRSSLKPSASVNLAWCCHGTMWLAQGNIITLFLCGAFFPVHLVRRLHMRQVVHVHAEAVAALGERRCCVRQLMSICLIGSIGWSFWILDVLSPSCVVGWPTTKCQKPALNSQRDDTLQSLLTTLPCQGEAKSKHVSTKVVVFAGDAVLCSIVQLNLKKYSNGWMPTHFFYICLFKL